LHNAFKGISKARKPAAPAKGKPQGINKKENTLAEKRKKAAKVPGAKTAKGKPAAKKRGE